MYSTHNEGKSVITEGLMKTLIAKIYKKWQLMLANLTMVVWTSDILMYSTHNEGKSVITEGLMKTLIAKIYKKWQLMLANLILVIWIS